jgi:hypothetical protein
VTRLGIRPCPSKKNTLEMPPACDRRSVRPFVVMKEVKLEAERRQVELVLVPTSEAIRLIEKEAALAFRGELLYTLRRCC